MTEEFDYLVTPNVFDCAIDLVSDGNNQPSWEAERIYGSPGHEIPTQGRLMFMDSSFPSPKESDTMTKGGVIVVKVKKTGDGSTQDHLNFRTAYKDRDGKEYCEVDPFEFVNSGTNFYSNVSIRKSVLLVRYVNFMKNYIRDCRLGKRSSKTNTMSMTKETGIFIPELSEAREANDLVPMNPLTPEYKEIFKAFIDYFEEEMEAINDPKLDRELQQLMKIYEVAPKITTSLRLG